MSINNKNFSTYLLYTYNYTIIYAFIRLRYKAVQYLGMICKTNSNEMRIYYIYYSNITEEKFSFENSVINCLTENSFCFFVS